MKCLAELSIFSLHSLTICKEKSWFVNDRTNCILPLTEILNQNQVERLDMQDNDLSLQQ